MPMFDYCKIILEKVSFDKILFEKELKKSITFLIPEEIDSFLNWTLLNFGEQYSEIITKIKDLL
jgi:hypothetical protein